MRVGVVVEEHREPERVGDPRGEVARGVDRGVLERCRRRARRTARRRARRTAGARRCARAGRRAPRPRERSARTAVEQAVAGQREHRAVVVGVDVQVEQRRAARSGRARRARRWSRPSDTLGTHSSTVAGYGRGAASDPGRVPRGAHRAGAPAVRLLGRRGVAAAVGDASSSTRVAGRARRVRLALAVRPPLPRRREVRRPARSPRRASTRSSRSPRSRGVVTRPRLGTLVLCEALRPASVLAKSLATLDRISDGRLDVGIGAGWYEPEYAAIGMTMPSPGERLARLREAIAVLPRPARRRTVHVRRALPPRDRRAEPSRRRCSSRRRRSSWAARATACSRSSPSSPTAGTRAGSGRPTTTASGSTCSSARATRSDRDPAIGAALARPLRAVRRGRARPRAALRAARRQTSPPGVLDGVTLDEWRQGRLVGTVEQVREQAAGWAGARRRDPDRRGRGGAVRRDRRRRRRTAGRGPPAVAVTPNGGSLVGSPRKGSSP